MLTEKPKLILLAMLTSKDTDDVKGDIDAVIGNADRNDETDPNTNTDGKVDTDGDG